MILAFLAIGAGAIGLLRLTFWVVDAWAREVRGLERERCAAELEIEAARCALGGERGSREAMGLREGARLLRGLPDQIVLRH